MHDKLCWLAGLCCGVADARHGDNSSTRKVELADPAAQVRCAEADSPQ